MPGSKEVSGKCVCEDATKIMTKQGCREDHTQVCTHRPRAFYLKHIDVCIEFHNCPPGHGHKLSGCEDCMRQDMFNGKQTRLSSTTRPLLKCNVLNINNNNCNNKIATPQKNSKVGLAVLYSRTLLW